MGKLIIKQKMFSVGGAFYVKNDRGEDVYQVKGSVLSWGKNSPSWICTAERRRGLNREC